MNIVKNITNRNRTIASNRLIQYIVIHYVGAVSSAKANSNYFKDTYRGASAHYFVDENEIYQVVEEKDIAWHCGASTYKHKYCRNTNSIGIEMCCFSNNGKIDISENVIIKTIELTKELMKTYNIPLENVLRHFDVTGKNCPAPMVENVSRWSNFKQKLNNNITYMAHVQNIGWQESKSNGELSGTTGQGLRIEAILINADINIQYRVHMQDKGWSEYVPNGCIAGTVGESRRIEAIEIISSSKEIIAQAHIENEGWLAESRGTHIKIGTEGRGLRLEALILKFA